MRIILITAAAVLGLAAGACGGSAGASDDRDQVVAAFYPLAFAAIETAGDRFSVHDLTPSGSEPHDLELSIRDVERIRSAAFVLILGGGFQPSVEDAAEQAEGDVLDLLAKLNLHSDDPHVWLDPKLYGQIVREVAAELGDESSAEPLVERLEALDTELRAGLADCDRRELVTSHAAFGHLAEAYDLEQIPIAGLSPEAETTPKDLERIAGLVRETGVTTVFVEPLAPPDEAETIARETGTRTETLNPIEGLTQDEVERGEDYFSLMRANLAVLREALGCR